MIRQAPSSSPFPFDDRAAIVNLAEAYWSLISERDAAEERAFERELPAARAAGHLSKSLFVRLARWKSVRNTPNYQSNTDAEVRAATSAAFSAPEDAVALQALMVLNGVALRTASAILQWMRPDRFPILDFRVVQALGRSMPASYDNVGFYATLAEEIRALAERNSLDLRMIDRALWAWSKRQPT